ncbi:MAG: radical SAM/SPASM domain-containing protein [Candidatus Micrarchaeaceae archaeon]
MAFEFMGLSYDALRSNFSRLNRPYKLNFAITLRCQSRCMTCNIWQIRPTGELTTDEIREFAAKNRSFRWIGLTGGEPFLRSDIVDIVKAFKENSKGLYMLTIPTNSLCDSDMVVNRIREMLELKVPRIVITLSLDGNRETHDRVRGIPGNYDKVIGMYKSLMDLKMEHPNLSFVFGYTMSSMNQGRFQETYRDVRMEIPEVDYDDFHMNIAQLSNNYYRNNSDSAIIADRNVILGELYGMKNAKRSKLSPMQLVEDRFLDGLITFTETGKPPVKCRSLDASLFMDSFGNVYPSIMWDRKLANIRDIGYDLDKAWNSGEANEIRNIIEEGKDPVHWTSCEAYQSILGSMLPIKRSGVDIRDDAGKRVPLKADAAVMESKVEN